jgi:hypothetical protein
MPGVGRLLDPVEVSEWLAVPVTSLYAQRYRGKSPGNLGLRVGRHLRFDPSDLEAWIEAQKGESGAAVTGRSPNPPVPVRKGRSR